MATYFDEMGWKELSEGEQPNHLLHMARFLLDFGSHSDDVLREWPSLPPPASKEVVKKLCEKVPDSKLNCPICLKGFSGDHNKAIELPCSHSFHPLCIITWLEKTNSCPYCRFEFPTDDEQYEAFKKEKKRAAQRKEDIEILHNSMFS